VITNEISEIQTELTILEGKTYPIYSNYFSLFQPEWIMSVYTQESVWGQVDSFQKEINVEENGMLNCIYNGQLNTEFGVYLTFFVDDKKIEVNNENEAEAILSYGTAKIDDNKVWETLNFIQIAPIAGGIHTISLQTQSDSTGNYEMAAAQIQCYVIYAQT
jgi:hypothetical protein